MGRWFRRDQKEEKPKENQEAPRENETDLASQTPAEPSLLPEPQAGPAVLPEPTGPGAEAPAPPAETRRGFFRRFRCDRLAAGEPPSENLSLESQPESSPEPLIPPDFAAGEALPEPGPGGGAESPRPDPEVPAADVSAEKPAPLEAEEETQESRKGMLRRLRERLGRTREALAGGLDRLFAGRQEVDAALLDELEELLITADLGVETTLFLIRGLHEKLKRRELGNVDRLKAALQAEMVALLKGPPPPAITSRPWVTLLVGVNGVGKTTTIAKLAHRDRLQGLTPLLVAGDTFRAAAVEQLEIWGERVGAAVVKQKAGADPAAVVFDGLTAAQARGVDTVYIDTAGRLHTKVNLMEELKKVRRTATRKLPGAPHEVLLILDATTGQNALSQVRLFHEAVEVTGIILTKMDGTAKGGVALAIAHETGIPLRYLGVGEAMEDLRPFDAEAFVQAILG